MAEGGNLQTNARGMIATERDIAYGYFYTVSDRFLNITADNFLQDPKTTFTMCLKFTSMLVKIIFLHSKFTLEIHIV